MSLVIGGLISGAVYTLVALGLILIIRVTGAINFAQGDVGSIGTFLAISLTGSGVGLPIVWACVLGILGGAASNVIIYLVLVRPMERAHAGALSTMAVTIGASLVIEAMLTVKYGFNQYTLNLFSGSGAIHVAGVAVPVSGGIIVVSAVAALLVVAAILYKTRLGLILRMGAANPMLSELKGVRLVLVRIIVWTFAGAIATWGIMLYSSYQSISTGTIDGFLLTAVIAASWGAFRSLSLTLGGAAALGMIFDVIARYTGEDITYIVALGILAVVYTLYQWRSVEVTSRLAHQALGVVRSWRNRDVRPMYRFNKRLGALEAAAAVIGLGCWIGLGGQYQQSLASEVGVALSAVAGLSISLRYCGRLNLGAAGFMCVGSYAFAVIGGQTDGAIGIICAVVLSACLGLGIGAITFKMNAMFYATLTLVLSVAVPEAIDLFTTYTGGEGGFSLSNTYGIPTSPWFVVAVGLVVAGVTVMLGLSRVGASTLLSAGSAPTAQSSGIHNRAHLVLAEGLSATMLGVSGILMAVSTGYLDPGSYTTSLSIGYLVATLVGGGWAIAGIVLASLFYVLLPAELAGLPNYPQAIYGAALAVVLLVVPSGLEGVCAMVYGRVRASLMYLGASWRRGLGGIPDTRRPAEEGSERGA